MFRERSFELRRRRGCVHSWYTGSTQDGLCYSGKSRISVVRFEQGSKGPRASTVTVGEDALWIYFLLLFIFFHAAADGRSALNLSSVRMLE